METAGLIVETQVAGSFSAHVEEMVAARASQNMIDPSHVSLFCIMRIFAPGNADEKTQLMASLQNPHVCTNARSAMTTMEGRSSAYLSAGAYRTGYFTNISCNGIHLWRCV